MPTPITFCSDLHLDHNPGLDEAFIDAYKEFGGLLILAGDVCNGVQLPVFEDTLKGLLEANSRVRIVFVMGNHDYYGAAYEDSQAYISHLDLGPQFITLHEDNPVTMIDDVLVHGSTLWYRDTPDTWLLRDSINDFKEIGGWDPDKAGAANRSFKEHLKSTASYSPSIWVTHHLPSHLSINNQYRGDRLNCYFMDPSMEELILDKQPTFVIHGHIHHHVCYQIGNTWVMANPHGYGRQNKDFNWFKHILFL